MAFTAIIVSALPSVIESHGLIGYSFPRRKPPCFVLTFFTAGLCEMVGVPYRLASRVLSSYRSMSQKVHVQPHIHDCTVKVQHTTARLPLIGRQASTQQRVLAYRKFSCEAG